MAIFGIGVFIIAAIIGLVGALANSGADHTVNNFTLLGLSIDASSGRVFLYGAIVGATAMMGLSMWLSGTRRSVQEHRKTKREQREQAKAENEVLDLTNTPESSRSETRLP